MSGTELTLVDHDMADVPRPEIPFYTHSFYRTFFFLMVVNYYLYKIKSIKSVYI